MIQNMTSPHLRAVVFDIGGVVLRSPLLAIAAYEAEKGLPRNYINISIARHAPSGAWQRFERGEMALFPFYVAFGRELSNTTAGNIWYKEYCQNRGLECPNLPEQVHIDGRELFGRMMRESATYDELMVEAIRRIKAAGKWRLIALTNNYGKADDSVWGQGAEAEEARLLYPEATAASEMEFLGWTDGATPPALRAMFDDFCDSSSLGMRKPDPEFYLLACQRNGINPRDCVFLDDLRMNLKVARQLGMETIHVPIGGSLDAIRQLEEKLGIDLIGPQQPSRL